jgi:hypothetical protein
MAVKEILLWVPARVGEALLDHPLPSVPPNTLEEKEGKKEKGKT